MDKLADIGGINEPPTIIDNNKTLNLTTPGPKYMVMSRVKSDDNISKVSPFLIKKGEGEVKKWHNID